MSDDGREPTAGEGLAAAVRRAVARTRTRAAVAMLLAVAAVAPGVLLVAWAIGRWPVRAGPLALVVAGGVAGLALAAVLTRRWVLAVDEGAVASAAERAGGLADGALRGVLELGRGLPDGVSPALLRREAVGLAARLAPGPTASPEGLAGEEGARARRRRTRMLVAAGGLTAVVTALGFAVPDRARAAWAPLLRPVAHLEAPALPPLAVTPGDTTVDRGAEVVVTVRAPLRDRATVHWRAVGDVPGRRTGPVEQGAARVGIGPVQAPTKYWATAPDGVTSDTFRIEPRDPLLLASLTVDAIYPEYTGLEADRYTGDVPPLRVPAGTVLRVRGRLTRPAGEVALDGPDGARRAVEVAGAGFGLDWRVGPDDEGVWSWRAADSSRLAAGGSRSEARGSRLEGAPPLALTVVPDAPPVVDVMVPGSDTVMPPGRRQPVVATASDDYGVVAGALVFRRLGAPDSTVMPFPVTVGGPRVLLRGLLDASSLGLVPGDAVEYWVTATDNRPGGQAGRSARYTLRLPSMAGLRDRAREEAGDVLDEARELADRSRSLESATRDVARRARSAQRERAGGNAMEPLDYDEAGRSREVLEEHEAVVSEVESLRERLASLQRAVAEAGLGDPELRRRLEEVRELYQRLASPELAGSMDDLRRALDALDPAAVQAALEQLAEHQASLRQQVEESLEMLRRAAAEQEMNALARDAEELAARQEALSAAAESAGREELGTRQEALGGETDDLAASLDSLRRELRSLREPEPGAAAEDAAGRAQVASSAMDTAASAVRAGESPRAAEAGRSAAGSVRSAAERLDGARQQMAGARAREAQAAVRRATLETLELAERQESLRRDLEAARRRGGLTADQLESARSEQAAVEQGVSQLTRTLAMAALRSALVDRSVGEALSQARQRVDDAGAGLESGGALPVRAAADAVESLNGLALSLLANEGRIQEAQAGGSGAQQAMRQLSELAQRQGSLNGQVGALTPLLDPGALARQLAELARRQAEIGQGVDEAGRALGDRDDVLGQVDELADEADALARALEAGRLDPEVRARQERLFRRLLDAGRSLEQDEYGRQRVAERPGDVSTDAPPPLDAELMDTGVRYPVPSAGQLRGLPPAYRALVLEYFDRLNRGAAEGGEGGGGGGGGG